MVSTTDVTLTLRVLRRHTRWARSRQPRRARAGQHRSTQDTRTRPPKDDDPAVEPPPSTAERITKSNSRMTLNPPRDQEIQLQPPLFPPAPTKCIPCTPLLPPPYLRKAPVETQGVKLPAADLGPVLPQHPLDAARDDPNPPHGTAPPPRPTRNTELRGPCCAPQQQHLHFFSFYL